VIPQQAVEKAIGEGFIEAYEYRGIQDGGMHLFIWKEEPHTEKQWRDFSCLLYPWEKIALDPSFWQCLGKALRWTDCTPCIAEEHRYPLDKNGNASNICKFCNEVFTPGTWQEIAHDFYDLILTGDDTNKFWNDLMSGTSNN
jgi:hypothetical protein